MKLKTLDIVTFAMLGALMFGSKKLMETLPNIHLLGTFIVAITVVYGVKALIPIYLYVFLDGVFFGFSANWAPYIYIWTILWGMVMLVPKRLPNKAKHIVYIALAGIHGFLFGTLYAPAHALFYGLDLKGMISWIIFGISADITHGISNIVLGSLLIMPIITILSQSIQTRTRLK